jgi:hypothetical protein
MRAFTGIGGLPPDDESALRAARIKDWTREAFGPGDATTVMVAEVACTEPGCPPIETVIALLGDGDPVEHRLHLPMADIAPVHLWQLAAGDHGCCR